VSMDQRLISEADLRVGEEEKGMDQEERASQETAVGSADGRKAPPGGDPTVAALDALLEVLELNAQERRVLARRLRDLRQARQGGMRWQDILWKEQAPGTMQVLSVMLARLSRASGLLRKELVSTLRAEGTSIPAIARMFGVTHQRVSNLLRRNSD
jgi:hypothetical protein